MKKDKNKLQKELDEIVAYLEGMINLALQEDYTSINRKYHAITIATKLRVLLNDEGSNKSLTNILGIKGDLRFQSVEVDFMGNIPANMLFTSTLTNMIINDNGVVYKVKEFSTSEDLLYTFDAWWNEIVIDSKFKEFSQISRRDIILTLVDKEGGAHVDEDYEQSYYQAINYDAIKYFNHQNEELKILNDVYAEASLYIAQEFINAYRIFNKFQPHTYYKSISKYKIFQLTYHREIERRNKKNICEKRYRFLRYKHGELNKFIMLLFDYYQLAEYKLLELYQISKCYPNVGVHYAMVVDLSSNSHKIVYARTPNCEKHVILWKVNERYKIINTEMDFENNEGFDSLENITKQLYPQEPNAFKEYFDKQIIEDR